MKKLNLIFILSALFAFTKINAQMPSVVTDLGSYTYYADMIVTGLEQFEKVSETLEIAKETQKMYKEVSNAVKSARVTTEVANNFKEIYNLSSGMPKIIANIQNKELRKTFGDKFEKIHKKCEILADLFNTTLRKDGLQGDDTSRLQFIYQVYEKSEELKEGLTSLKAEIYFR